MKHVQGTTMKHTPVTTLEQLRSINMRTKIYGFFNSKQEFGDAEGIAITEHGTVVTSHVSSSESWSKHDLGMIEGSTVHHDEYDAACPEGWTTEFVSIADDRDNHEGLQKALTLYAKNNSAEA